MSHDQEFLDAVLAHLAEGVKSFRADRAESPHITDAEFIHGAGTAAAQVASLETAVLLSTVAMYRITQLEDALRDMAERNHSMHAHNTEFTIDKCRRDECFHALDLLGDHGD